MYKQRISMKRGSFLYPKNLKMKVPNQMMNGNYLYTIENKEETNEKKMQVYSINLFQMEKDHAVAIRRLMRLDTFK